MKPKIHPKYYDKAKVTCACGNEFETGSTKDKIHVEICSACHPFFTGKKKLIDTAGRVDRFKDRMAKKKDLKTKVSAQQKTQKAKPKAKKQAKPKTKAKAKTKK